MVLHRHHHGPLHTVRNVRGSRDEQEISAWHAASHHVLLFRYQGIASATIPPKASARAGRRPMRPILSVRGRKDQASAPGARAPWSGSFRPPAPPSLVRRDCFEAPILDGIRFPIAIIKVPPLVFVEGKPLRLHVPAQEVPQTAL